MTMYFTISSVLQFTFMIQCYSNKLNQILHHIQLYLFTFNVIPKFNDEIYQIKKIV